MNELLLILRWYVEEGGTRLVVNSDAHGAWQLGENNEAAADILNAVGLAPVHDLESATAGASAVEEKIMANVLNGGWR